MARKGRKSQSFLIGETIRVPLTPAAQLRSRLSIGSNTDRYITRLNPNASLLNITPTKPTTAESPVSPNHVARLASATFTLPGGRILDLNQSPSSSFVAPNPLATPLPPHPLQTRYYVPNGEQTMRKGKILHIMPERVLDAPEMRPEEEGCTRLIAWSSNGLIVGINRRAFLWNPTTAAVSIVATTSPSTRWITALEWSSRFSKLALLDSHGSVILVDPTKRLTVWKSEKHLPENVTSSMCVANDLLALGNSNGKLQLLDPRVRKPAHEVQAHRGAFSGLRLRADGTVIASAGYDKTLRVWDVRQLPSPSSNEKCLWVARGFSFPTRALAWCPWHPSVLAFDCHSYNGVDASLYCWNIDTDELASSVKKFSSSIKTIHFSTLTKQVLTTHGFPGNFIQAHRFSNMTTLATTKNDSHYDPVTYAAVNPSGTVVATGSADQCIKIWRFWETPKKQIYHPSERPTIRGTEMLR